MHVRTPNLICGTSSQKDSKLELFRGEIKWKLCPVQFEVRLNGVYLLIFFPENSEWMEGFQVTSSAFVNLTLFNF